MKKETKNEAQLQLLPLPTWSYYGKTKFYEVHSCPMFNQESYHLHIFIPSEEKTDQQQQVKIKTLFSASLAEANSLPDSPNFPSFYFKNKGESIWRMVF